jgi:hypothetical protein
VEAAMASVFVFIRLVEIESERLRLRIREVIFIEDGFRHNVFLGSPRAEIREAAAVATEWKVRVVFGVSGFFADRAFVFHGEIRVLPQRAPRSHKRNGENEVGTNRQFV